MIVKGVFREGRVLIDLLPNWPGGCEVEVQPSALEANRMGIDESEWSDDPEALRDWESWLATIEPLEFTPEEELERANFEKLMREYNLEAVRKQFEVNL